MVIDLRWTAVAQAMWERIVGAGETGDEMAVLWIAEKLQAAYDTGYEEA